MIWPTCDTSTSGSEKKGCSSYSQASYCQSVYFSPSTVEPSPKGSENVLERSCAVELASGSYSLCPEQLDPYFGEGKKRLLLLVSRSTVACGGSASGFESSCRKVIPAKFTGGGPMEMAPNQNCVLSSVDKSLPLACPESWILQEKGCGTPVFLSCVANQLLKFPISDR